MTFSSMDGRKKDINLAEDLETVNQCKPRSFLCVVLLYSLNPYYNSHLIDNLDFEEKVYIKNIMRHCLKVLCRAGCLFLIGWSWRGGSICDDVHLQGQLLESAVHNVPDRQR